MKKFDNIAVVLRGHIRTWEYNAPVVFDFYDKIAHNVDYFLSTWNTPGVRYEKVKKIFKRSNKQYKEFIAVDFQEGNYTSWEGPAHLSLHIAPYLRLQHQLTPYQAVFDSRFDVLAHLTENVNFTPSVLDNTLYTTSFTNLLDKHGDRNIGMTDHMLVSTVDVFCKMNDRITVKSRDTRECHVDMLDFAKRQGIKPSNAIPWLTAIMTRPVDAVRYPDPFSATKMHLAPASDEYPPWVDCTVEDRLRLCNQFDIEPLDYVTNNGNIAVAFPQDKHFEAIRNKIVLDF